MCFFLSFGKSTKDRRNWVKGKGPKREGQWRNWSWQKLPPIQEIERRRWEDAETYIIEFFMHKVKLQCTASHKNIMHAYLHMVHIFFHLFFFCHPILSIVIVLIFVWWVPRTTLNSSLSLCLRFTLILTTTTKIYLHTYTHTGTLCTTFHSPFLYLFLVNNQYYNILSRF